MTDNFCRCKHCTYCARRKITFSRSAKRSEYWCNHPLREKIREYFTKHNIHKAEGFIGFSKPDGSFPIKRTPAWCPDREAEEEAEA